MFVRLTSVQLQKVLNCETAGSESLQTDPEHLQGSITSEIKTVSKIHSSTNQIKAKLLYFCCSEYFTARSQSLLMKCGSDRAQESEALTSTLIHCTGLSAILYLNLLDSNIHFCHNTYTCRTNISSSTALHAHIR